MRLSEDPNYRRLASGSLGLASRASYWAGPDHLLMVQVENYTEGYRRVAYRDVQAVVVRQTQFRRWVGAISLLGTILSFVGLAGVTFGGDGSVVTEGWEAGVVVLSCLAAVCVGVVLWNALAGPSCCCEIRTAVQMLVLPGLRRRSKVERFVGAFAPLVEAAQGPAESPVLNDSPVTSEAGSRTEEAAAGEASPASSGPGTEPGPSG
jgi:hypothetical protein